MLEEAEQLEPRVSALEEDMDDVESSEEEEEEDEKVRHLGAEGLQEGELQGMGMSFLFCFQTLFSFNQKRKPPKYSISSLRVWVLELNGLDPYLSPPVCYWHYVM